MHIFLNKFLSSSLPWISDPNSVKFSVLVFGGDCDAALRRITIVVTLNEKKNCILFHMENCSVVVVPICSSLFFFCFVCSVFSLYYMPLLNIRIYKFCMISCCFEYGRIQVQVSCHRNGSITIYQDNDDDDDTKKFLFFFNNFPI